MIFKWLLTLVIFSFQRNVVKANKLYYLFYIFFFLLSVPGKHQKGTKILHSKYLNPTSFSLGRVIFYIYTLQFLSDMCDLWHFAPVFFPFLDYNKSRPHKNMFLVALTQCPVKSELFFLFLLVFKIDQSLERHLLQSG